jgi:hypothetical protein
LLYSRKDTKSYKKLVDKFKSFLHGYEFTDDIEGVIATISESEKLTPLHYKLLELYAKKINQVSKENYSEVDKINKEILSAKKKLIQD